MTQTSMTNITCGAPLPDVFCPNHTGGSPKRAENKGGMSRERLRRVMEHVEKNLDQKIELRELASIVSLSMHHFADLFKAETGKSPHNFLIDRRVRRAQELLLKSNVSIAQIAVEVGFSGQSHLTQHFRRRTGTTPFRFRLSRNEI